MQRDLGISLVIPVRNEAAKISDLLASIHGSVDVTVQILREAAGEDSFLRVLEAKDATPGRGRNIGIEAASNDWIALTDAGVWLGPTWLEGSRS
jgi:glycosyltransferase involved in cell wall biosynthesis